jgi:hypothetical protein
MININVYMDSINDINNLNIKFRMNLLIFKIAFFVSLLFALTMANDNSTTGNGTTSSSSREYESVAVGPTCSNSSFCRDLMDSDEYCCFNITSQYDG